mmetsp:Transcript_37749/g.82660  ORF Transcript_37749/g.82660 Transcript_37749/m.82660 type:complete len:196 (+) Transcript_37749:31-618(+)|eukprot:CAMPEP_0204368610 /NCGR_PEP_ID=MMETSP0469-20131031/44321_1 /ASSEMBLY_ACC=CAM_ASM_000384 /TAXON_ID=2969 /ORGANISM="Oxyrrhis marina" /LENGTH=195 /DNA_ID=CAMNT_0051358199 /DNA_START=25 /DNA_END=612 /DNA_ORIENTATION=-
MFHKVSLLLLVVVAGKTDDEVYKNWQEDWTRDVESCAKRHKPIFTGKNGKAISRKVKDLPEEMAYLLADNMDADTSKGRKVEKPKPPTKKTKKQRRMEELTQVMTGSFATLDQAPLRTRDDPERMQQLASMSTNMLVQAMKRAKLGPEDKLTLKEFCDVVWRAGNPSPLDPEEEPEKKAPPISIDEEPKPASDEL